MPGFSVADARVAVGAPRIPRLVDADYVSCARTVFWSRRDRTRFGVAIPRNARNPSAVATSRPAPATFASHRLGPAWLVVAGGPPQPRHRMLASLVARL